MITLHHLENSQSFRIIWLFEELGIPYELKTYQRDPRTSLATAEYKALHPAGTAPIITDGNIALAETNAIIDYVLDQYPDSPLRPVVGSPQRIAYLYWFHTALGSMMPMLIMLFVFGIMTKKSPILLRPLIKKVTQKTAQMLPMPRVKSLLGYMNAALANTAYLAGDEFSAADIVMVYNLDGIENRLQLFDFSEDYPHISTYLQRIRTRKAYLAAVEKDDV